MKYAIIYLFLGLLIFIQCSKEDNTAEIKDEDKIAATITDFGAADHALAFDVLHQVIQSGDTDGKNVIVSPLSIHTALLMVLNGADRETRDAIAQTIHSADFSESSLNEAYRAYVENLNNADEKTELSISNAMFWDDVRIFPDADFTSRLHTYYDAETQGMNLQVPSALETINGWVDEKTHGRIDKILENIGPDEVLFLINALYFKGDWQNGFPPDYTSDRAFHLSDGEVISVPTMSQDDRYLHYIGNDYKALDLTFGDSVFSMTLIMPTDVQQDIDAFMAGFSPDELENLYQEKLQLDRVQVFLPKFEAAYKIRLNDVLKALGMEVAFNPSEADLTRLGNAPEGNLYISRVEHKTFLMIDEKGAEGAAVTAVGVGVTSAPPTIAFDRPFMLILRDIQHSAIVFIGKIEDPRGQ